MTDLVKQGLETNNLVLTHTQDRPSKGVPSVEECNGAISASAELMTSTVGLIVCV
jgi:hypothetical protein